MTLHCVCFHVDLSERGQKAHPWVSLKHDENISMMNMMFRSFLLFAPKSQLHLLTDRLTSLSGLLRKVNVVRGDVAPESLMYDRMVQQRNFLQATPSGDMVCFLDSDILVNKSLDSVFAEAFDVALTFRANDTMPINGGVMFVRAGEGGQRFFSRCLEHYEPLEASQRRWWGDQTALAVFLGGKKEFTSGEICTIDGVKILFLDARHYNFTPKSVTAIEEYNKKRFLWHFKGNKKVLMAPYWFMHLNMQRRDWLKYFKRYWARRKWAAMTDEDIA